LGAIGPIGLTDPAFVNEYYIESFGWKDDNFRCIFVYTHHLFWGGGGFELMCFVLADEYYMYRLKPTFPDLPIGLAG
jgi:hypothetical protein